MVSVVRAEDSSSASANLPVIIQQTEWASASVLKVYLAEGPSFFVRAIYLPEMPDCFPDQIPESGLVLTEETAAVLVHSARVYLAERAAMEYLARAEYSRQQLELRLLKKGYDASESAPALDYLESGKMLDDARFASAWLRSRMIHQCEGKRKLLAGLRAHGVSFSDAEAALDSFFSETDELALCKKATEKLRRQGKNGEKLFSALIRKGFSSKTISEAGKISEND